jgi:2-polyprenyl-6-methoxyphenol hydroxylase-like FAD-dependent oxidoreductase
LNLSGLADNPLYGLQIRQARLESLLEQHAVELGVDLRRGHRLQELHQEDDAVTVRVQGPDGGYEMRTQYLVGCDGAGSYAGEAIPGFGCQATFRQRTKRSWRGGGPRQMSRAVPAAVSVRLARLKLPVSQKTFTNWSPSIGARTDSRVRVRARPSILDVDADG